MESYFKDKRQLNTNQLLINAQRNIKNLGLSVGGRVPPNSQTAEESVLGGIMLSNEAINIALENLKPDDFYRPAHQVIFQAMMQLSEKLEPVDLVTLANKLKSFNALDEVGGYEYLAKLASIVPSIANIEYYTRIVKDLSLRRRVISEASEIIQESFSEEGSVAEFIDQVEQRILSISSDRSKTSYFKIQDIVANAVKSIEDRFHDKLSSVVTGAPSGFTKLDEITAGFQPSDLIILAARPSMGKTALSLSIGAHIGIRCHKRVLIFSLEMSKEQLAIRLLCSEASVENTRVRTGKLLKGDFSQIVAAASFLTDAEIFIDDTPALTPTEVRAKCRRLHREKPLELVIVDYLQLMRNPLYSNSREQEISNISRSLKALAKELNIPIIALSQLNRSVETRQDKRPMMSDLRESGAIEQDADLIMMLYRDEVYNPESEDKDIAEIIVTKQRNGPTGVAKVCFRSQYTRFDNLAYDDEVEQILGVNSEYNKEQATDLPNTQLQNNNINNLNPNNRDEPLF
jgi:replicative DNA helicase